MTYFKDPENGERDALLHFVEGGVYPKMYPQVMGEFKRTGDLMPVMTKFARIAPSGLARYRSDNFGSEYQGNLFTAQFNPHRVQRHVVHREGATFRTDDSDFLTSTDPDFHPTDVLEDADGSLLVLDTGAWFIHGCPISRVAKPEIKGAIYRIRKSDAPRGAGSSRRQTRSRSRHRSQMLPSSLKTPGPPYAIGQSSSWCKQARQRCPSADIIARFFEARRSTGRRRLRAIPHRYARSPRRSPRRPQRLRFQRSHRRRAMRRHEPRCGSRPATDGDREGRSSRGTPAGDRGTRPDRRCARDACPDRCSR